MKTLWFVPGDRRKLFAAALIIFVFSLAAILIVIPIDEPVGLLCELYLAGEISSASFMTFFIALGLFLLALYLTERMPRNWKRALLRTGIGAVLLTPGVFMDPAVVFSTFVPAVIPVLYYAFVAVQSLETVIFSIATLIAVPIWIVWAGLTLVAALRTRD